MFVNIACENDSHNFILVEETISGNSGKIQWYQCSKCGMPVTDEIEIFKGEIKTIMTIEREIKISSL